MIIPDGWKLGMRAILFVGVLSIFSWLAIARANLKAEVAETRSNFALCENANAEWEAKIKTCNDTTRKWKEETDRQTAETQKAYKATLKLAKAHAAKAQSIMASSDKGNDCQAAQSLIRRYLGEHK
jgi:hypothetical protein